MTAIGAGALNYVDLMVIKRVSWGSLPASLARALRENNLGWMDYWDLEVRGANVVRPGTNRLTPFWPSTTVRRADLRKAARGG